MSSFSLTNLHKGEVVLLRKALDDVDIKGRDAAFVAQLQQKVENVLNPPASKPPVKKGK